MRGELQRRIIYPRKSLESKAVIIVTGGDGDDAKDDDVAIVTSGSLEHGQSLGDSVSYSPLSFPTLIEFTQ